MTSTTFDLRAANGRKNRPTPAYLAGLIARVAHYSKVVGRFIRMPAPGVPEATAQLLRMAEAYESTQPSYAADLRAAASMSERQQTKSY